MGFEAHFKNAKPLDVVYAHHDGRAVIMTGNGTVRLPAVAFKALCNAGLLTKGDVPFEKGVDIYTLPKRDPLAEALLGDDDPFEGL